LIERIAVSDDPERTLTAAGLQPSAWSAQPHTHFPVHAHERTKRLFVRRGDISFNGKWLHAPAAIRIAANTEHEAEVGAHGVECVEAFE
jgi:hypothetical protein